MEIQRSLFESIEESSPVACNGCPYNKHHRVRFYEEREIKCSDTLVIVDARTDHEMGGFKYDRYIKKFYPGAMVIPHIMCGLKYPGEIPKQGAMSHCKRLINKYIEKFNYKKIIVSGSKAVSQFIGTIGGDLKNHGIIYDYNGTPAIVELGLAMLMSSPEISDMVVKKDPSKMKPIELKYTVISSDSELEPIILDVMNDILTSEIVALDIETNGLKDVLYGITDKEVYLEQEMFKADIKKPIITAIGIGTDDNIYIFPVKHFQREYVGTMLYDVILPTVLSREVVGANIGFDLQWLNRALNMPFPEKARDILLEDFLERQLPGHGGLKENTRRNFYYPDWESDIHLYPSYELIPWPRLEEYLAHDINATRMNARYYPPRIQHAWEFYNDVLTTAVVSYAKMQNRGMKLIPASGSGIDKKIQSSYMRIQKEAKLVGSKKPRINPGSNKDLAHVLFELSGFSPVEETDSGMPSLNKESLHIFSTKLGSDFAEAVLEWRALTKIKSTYLSIPTKKSTKDYIVHTNYSLYRTASGRTASSNPNFQNLPRGDSPVAALVKKMVVSRYRGGLIIESDFSQAELRCLASVSSDRNMIREYLQQMADAGYSPDLHKLAASYMLDLPVSEITKALRQFGKVINFGLFYGMTEYGLHYNLRKVCAEKGIDVPHEVEDCIVLLTKYFKGFPGVDRYMKKYRAFAKNNGYVLSPMGRKRVLMGATDKNSPKHKGAMNKAINTPIQVLASDLKIMTVNKITKLIEDQDLPCSLINEVHDSCIIDLHDAKYAEEVIGLMEMCFGASSFPGMVVPMIADSKIGPSWGETKTVMPKRCWKCANMQSGICLIGMTNISKGFLEDTLQAENRYIPCLGYKKIDKK